MCLECNTHTIQCIRNYRLAYKRYNVVLSKGQLCLVAKEQSTKDVQMNAWEGRGYAECGQKWKGEVFQYMWTSAT